MSIERWTMIDGRSIIVSLFHAQGASAMKLGLINSAWAQAGQDTAYGIRMTKEIGFDSIDIFADPLDDADDAERKLIKAECDRSGLPIVSVACVALGLVDFNPSVRRFHLDRCRAYLDMVRQFEAKNLLLVLGEYVWQKEVIPPVEQWKSAVACVRTLGEQAETLGLEIALELEPFHMSLLHDVDSMARFLDDVGHPSVKANLDISHLALAHQPAGLIEKLRGKIAHVHISDCDGRVHGDLPPGRGVVDFAPYLEAIKLLNLADATISIELEYSPEPDRIGDWVREAYDATAGLMRAAGLRA
jgi:sugar phosphate isomerase/epimerase